IRRFGEDPEIYIWMFASAAALGRTDEAQALLDRAWELFGDDSPSPYLANMSLNFALIHGQTERARAILDHWIPLLRARHEAAPDNYRMFGQLVSTQGFAGDTVAMRRDLLKFLHALELVPHANPSGEMAPCFKGIAYSGDTATFNLTVAVARRMELANL